MSFVFQPIIKDDQGVLRFRRNEMAASLFGESNAQELLESMAIDIFDKAHFAQLTGMSVVEFNRLPFLTKGMHIGMDEAQMYASAVLAEDPVEQESTMAHTLDAVTGFSNDIPGYRSGRR